MVVLRGRPSRTGFAAIVDSLMFLAVVLVVALALSASLTNPEPKVADLTEMASDAHRALLGCEARIEVNGTLLPQMSISTLSISFAANHDPGMDDEIRAKVEKILDAIVPPSLSFQWTLTSEGQRFLAVGDDPGSEPSFYSSTIELSSSGKIVSVLILWA